MGWNKEIPKVTRLTFDDGDKLDVSIYDDVEVRFSVADSIGVYVPVGELRPLIEMLESYAE